MYFVQLQNRLLALLRERIQNGELTERQLARLTGISQPHIHNVLKGVRIFSLESADEVLRGLNLTVLDFVDPIPRGAGLKPRAGSSPPHMAD